MSKHKRLVNVDLLGQLRTFLMDAERLTGSNLTIRTAIDVLRDLAANSEEAEKLLDRSI